MAWPASTLSPPAPGGDEEEAEEAEPRLLPRSSPTPRPRPAEEEAVAASRAETGGARRVRFADALGLPLAAVQCYDSLGAALGLPLAAAQRHCSPCCSQPCSPHQQEALCNGILGPALSPDPAQELGALGLPRRGPQSHFYLSPSFLLPPSPQQLEQRVQACGVELESLLPSPAEPRAMRGVLRVLNLSYRKSVYVRATFDRWASFYDHPADYLAPCDHGRTDQFAFRLAFAPPYDYDGARLEFVVRYETPGQTFWANNGGRNYGVLLKAAGGVPASPPVKHSLPEPRRLKSCLKPVKNRFAEECAGMVKAQDTFLTAGLTTEQDVVPNLVKPTPLHPERPHNQVPRLVVTSTSPETFHSSRPMTFTESNLELATKQGKCVSSSSEPMIGLREHCEEDENRPRKDKSTWIGDLSMLRHAGSRFLNGEDDTTGLAQELMPGRSLLERPVDRPLSCCWLDHPYVVPAPEDSDNEDAVEAELEQLYLSHLSRLQAAKDLKEPGEADAAPGTTNHIHTDWHTDVSPLDLAGTKRILNTWLAEEISLRHANGGEEEEGMPVAHLDAELASSVCELPPSFQEEGSEKKEASPTVCVSKSLEDSLAEEEGNALCSKKASKDKAHGSGMDLPKMPGGGVFHAGDNAQSSALSHTSKESSYSSPAAPERKAMDSVLSCMPCEFVSVTQDTITFSECHFDSTADMLDYSARDKVKPLPKTEGKNICQGLDAEKKLLTQDNAVGTLSIYSQHGLQIKPQQESKGACGFKTSWHLHENVPPTQEHSGLESYKNLFETALPDEGLSILKPLQHLEENVLLIRECLGFDASQNLQDSVPLSEDHSEVDTSRTLPEDALLSQELSQRETTENLPDKFPLSQQLSQLETSENLQEIILLSQELSQIERSHNLQESVLLSEEFCGLDTSHNLQESALLNRDISLRVTPKSKQEIILLSEELSRLETSENLQENILLSEEFSVLETSQTLQEIVLLNEELYGLGTSQRLHEHVLLSKGVSERDTFQNLPLAGEEALNGYTLSAVLEEEFGYNSSSGTLLGGGLAYVGSSSAATWEGLKVTDYALLGDGLGHLGSSSTLVGEGVGSQDCFSAFRGKDSSQILLGEGLEHPDTSLALLVEKLPCRGPSSALLVEGLGCLDCYSTPCSQEVVCGGSNSIGNSDANSTFPGEELKFPDSSPALPGQELEFPDSSQAFPGEELEFPDSSQALPGEELEFPDSSQALPGEELEFPDSSQALPGEELEFPDSSQALPGEELEFLDSSQALPGEELEFPDSSQALPGEELEFPDSSQAFPGEELAFPDSIPALPSTKLELLVCSPALLGDSLGFSGSCSGPLSESQQDRDLGLCIEDALSQSFSFLCALVLLLVMLQDCTSFVAVPLLLMWVWFL
ncbi:protein phosphatase 1 regulatory subunit 3F [Pleurodeles waltl]|uniref:protein phosphatase 1 regulatory subunit 3F n=1 Tax=Pleurodeles waltl TaxID=8319 RepID=UPI003709ABB3